MIFYLVNTYYYIQGLQETKEAARILHHEEPEWLEERLRQARDAVVNTYFDRQTEDFCGGIGAANAFALNLGLGTARTKENLITKYKELGRLDTGIFGTPVLVERLFREGEADLAFTMLANRSRISFAEMMKNGATTLWEKWEGSDSHDHPMFGSVVKLLFTEILGIRQKEGSCGYTDLFADPADIKALTWAEGSLRTSAGTVSVSWKRDAEGCIIINKKEEKSEKCEKKI